MKIMSTVVHLFVTIFEYTINLWTEMDKNRTKTFANKKTV